MKKLFICLLFNLLLLNLQGQDTFSIAAVDPETGEVGSAGATCLDTVIEGVSAIVISYLKPGKGSINAQALLNTTNKNNAIARMDSGDTPAEIITWLQANDVDGTPDVRQYGIADIDDSDMPRTAGFTGANALDYKGHLTGTNYVIAGNILSGPAILDSMEINFFFEEGDLANKLMAALQGANKPGADSRCLAAGVSSRSAFIRVAKPTDSATYFLDINVGATPSGVDPIDVLQGLFDDWREDNPVMPPSTGLNLPVSGLVVAIKPHPASGASILELTFKDESLPEQLQLLITDLSGRQLVDRSWDGTAIQMSELQLDRGMYILQLGLEGKLLYTKQFTYFE